MLGKILTVVAVGAVCVGVGHRLGYKDGWMAYAIDSMAVQNYHWSADNLEDDSDPVALSNVWSNCIVGATQTETQWNQLPLEKKWNYPAKPFWKQNVGEPRRISRAGRERIIKVMKEANQR